MGVYSTFCKAAAPVMSSLNKAGARIAGSRAAGIAMSEARGLRSYAMFGYSQGGFKGAARGIGNFATSNQMRRNVAIGGGVGLGVGLGMAGLGMFGNKRRRRY